jgi:hypothetical protein
MELVPAPELLVVALAALAALVMLARGDSHWTWPVIAATLAFVVVPSVPPLVIRMFYPHGIEPPPAVLSPDLQRELERNYNVTRATLEAIKAAQLAAAGATYATAWKDVAVSTAAAFAPGSALVTVTKWAIGLSRLDPIYHIASGAYNLLTSLGMIYHFLDMMAELAVSWALPLMALSMLAVTASRTRALAGLMLSVSLFMVLMSFTGYYLSPLALSTAMWCRESAAWALKLAENITGAHPAPYLVVDGAPHTLYIARYNNIFIEPNIARIVSEVPLLANSSARAQIQQSVIEALRRAGGRGAVFNGTDWIAATTGSLTPVAYGSKNWSALAVHTWLDFPAPAPQNGTCIARESLADLLRLAVQEAERRGYQPPSGIGELANETARRACNVSASLGYISYYARLRLPGHWRVLHARINYTARDRWRVLSSGAANASVGVWGWVVPPDEERCVDALGRESPCGALRAWIREGVYNFSLWSGERRAADPATGAARSAFNITLPEAPHPLLSREIELHAWTETCRWCCGWSNGTCARYCSTSRLWRERYRAEKVSRVVNYTYGVTVYLRPWALESPVNHTGAIPVVAREWNVTVWAEPGPWDNGPPPEGASCSHGERRVYHVLQLYRARPGPVRAAYGFWWLGGGVPRIAPRGESLPDAIGGSANESGIGYTRLLEGAEHNFYCAAEVLPASEPDWRVVQHAERNLTALLVDDYLNRAILHNYTRAYLSLYGAGGAFARSQDPALEGIARTARELLDALERAPDSLPIYYTAPTSYQGRNVIFACVSYDWRGAVRVNGSLALTPAREWWAARYPVGDSRVARQYRELARAYRLALASPPPPPPAELGPLIGTRWDIPWDNRSLPYRPHYHPGMRMPPRDNRTGVPPWDASRLTSALAATAGVGANVLHVLFISTLATAAVFEFMALLFEFPSPLRFLYCLTTRVIQEWTYWLPFRLFVRARLLARVWRAVRAPALRLAARAAARVHAFLASRSPGLARVRSAALGLYFKRRVRITGDPSEALRKEVRRKLREDVLRRIGHALERVDWYRELLKSREEGGRRRAELARRARAALGARDAVGLARAIFTGLDKRLREFVESRRHSLSYYLFWWRLDRLGPLERAFARLTPAAVLRDYHAGRISEREAEELANLYELLRARLAEASAGALRKAAAGPRDAYWTLREAARRASERGLKALGQFARELLRRADDVRAPNAAVRRQAVRELAGLLRGAIAELSKVDAAARARIVSSLNEALRERAEKIPRLPRRAPPEEIVERLAALGRELAAEIMTRSLEMLRAHYEVAPAVPDAKSVIAEIIRERVAEMIPTLKLAGLARGIVLGARNVREGELALRAWSHAPSLSRVEEAPWEAVAYRYSEFRSHERLDVRRLVKIGPDVVLASKRAEHLARPRVDERALNALQKAVEYRRLLDAGAVSEAERLKREVLRETWEITREFSESVAQTLNALEGRRARGNAPEMEEVARAFEASLGDALRAPPDKRSEAFAELLLSRAEEIARRYELFGAEQEAERVRRVTEELLQVMKKAGWSAPEEVKGVKLGESLGEELDALERLRRELLECASAKRGCEIAGRALQLAKSLAGKYGLKVPEPLPEPAGRRQLLRALRDVDKALELLSSLRDLVTFAERPALNADLARLLRAARLLGLEQTARFLRALAEARAALWRRGAPPRGHRQWEPLALARRARLRALIRAPLYSYVVDALGEYVLKCVYTRWRAIFAEYGKYVATAFDHARSSPVRAAAPVSLRGFSYVSAVMRWLGGLSDDAVAGGLRAYYSADGRPFRELARFTLLGARAVLFERAADAIKRALGGEKAELTAAILRARAALEELKLAQLYLNSVRRRAEELLRAAELISDEEKAARLRGEAESAISRAERVVGRITGSARARYAESLRAAMRHLSDSPLTARIGHALYGLTARAFVGDPEEVATRMIKFLDARRLAAWVDKLVLDKELGELAVRIVEAERLLRGLERALGKGAQAADYAPAVGALSCLERCELPEVKTSAVERAVVSAVRDIIKHYESVLRERALRAAPYLAIARGDARFASGPLARAAGALRLAARAGSAPEASSALRRARDALRELGIEVEGESPAGIVGAVERAFRQAYEEYVAAVREFARAINALAGFSSEAALELYRAARACSRDAVGRLIAARLAETAKRALREYAPLWRRGLEERWGSLPREIKELVARKEREAVAALARRVLKSAGIHVTAGDLEGVAEALRKALTPGPLDPLADRVRARVEDFTAAVERFARGEAGASEVRGAIKALLRELGSAIARHATAARLEDVVRQARRALRASLRRAAVRLEGRALAMAFLLHVAEMPRELAASFGDLLARGRNALRPWVAYETESWRLARLAGSLGMSVIRARAPSRFDERGAPLGSWKFVYIIVPRGFDLPAVERELLRHVYSQPGGIAHIEPGHWPVPESFIWHVLKGLNPVRTRTGIIVVAPQERPLTRALSEFEQRLRALDSSGAREIVMRLLELGERAPDTALRILWHEDPSGALSALRFVSGRYGEPLERAWERRDEVFLTWLAFRLAGVFERFLASGAGRGLGREELLRVADLSWLPNKLAGPFALRLLGDSGGLRTFADMWRAAVAARFGELAPRYAPESERAARRTIELFCAFTGAQIHYEDTLSAAMPPRRRPETRSEVKTGMKTTPRTLMAPTPDVIPSYAPDPIEYLIARFGAVARGDMAERARERALAEIKSRVERVALRDPVLAAIYARLADYVLDKFGRLVVSREAARHARDALLYYFEGYLTRDGARLAERIEDRLAEIIAEAESAGIRNAERQIKQWVVELLGVISMAAEEAAGG